MTTADENQDFAEPELQVIFGICVGLRNEEMAERYRIDVDAVMNARADAYHKAAVSTAVELYLFVRAALNNELRRRRNP
jgi:DNA-binding NarL/FixJ family response regulator